MLVLKSCVPRREGIGHPRDDLLVLHQREHDMMTLSWQAARGAASGELSAAVVVGRRLDHGAQALQARPVGPSAGTVKAKLA